MKKYILAVAVLGALLAGCSQKKAEPAADKADKKEISTDLPIIKDAEQQQVISRTLVIPTDQEGAQQTQTITYQGGRFQTLVIERVSPTDAELKEAIQQLGQEEAQKSLNESLEKDEAYSQARTLPGFSSRVTILNPDSIKISSTYDFQTLNVDKAAEMPYFANQNLKEMIQAGPEEYINRLVAAGAQEQQ